MTNNRISGSVPYCCSVMMNRNVEQNIGLRPLFSQFGDAGSRKNSDGGDLQVCEIKCWIDKQQITRHIHLERLVRLVA
jgi:hypothetical protein